MSRNLRSRSSRRSEQVSILELIIAGVTMAILVAGLILTDMHQRQRDEEAATSEPWGTVPAPPL